MNATDYKPSAAEITEYLASHPAHDVFDAEAALIQRHSAKRPAAAPDKTTSWRLEPSLAEIENEMRTHGLSIKDAREKLRKEYDADARLLESYDPDAAEEISTALAAADEANRKAAELTAQREQTFYDLKSQIVILCDVRSKIKILRGLILEKPAAKHLAATALEFCLAMRGGAVSEYTKSGFETSMRDLVFRSALTPFLPAAIAGLESEAEQLISAARQLADKNKIDLQNFIRVWATERGKGGASLPLDQDLWEGLLPSAK